MGKTNGKHVELSTNSAKLSQLVVRSSCMKIRPFELQDQIRFRKWAVTLSS